MAAICAPSAPAASKKGCGTCELDAAYTAMLFISVIYVCYENRTVAYVCKSTNLSPTCTPGPRLIRIVTRQCRCATLRTANTMPSTGQAARSPAAIGFCPHLTYPVPAFVHAGFQGRKKGLRNFEIGRTYFKICALLFFFAQRGEKTVPLFNRKTQTAF